MRRFLIAAALLALFCAALPSQDEPEATAGDPLDEKILEMTRKIGANPLDDDAFVARGLLLRERLQLELARADFEHARKIDPENRPAWFYDAWCLLDLGRPEDALPVIDRFLLGVPGHPEGLLLRARILTQIRPDFDTADAWDLAMTAIEKKGMARTSLYLERADFVESLGNGARPRAIAGLEQGLRVLGSKPALELRALELEIRVGRNAAALQRLERLAEESERPEVWHAQKGDVLAAMGRRKEAETAYREALAALATRSPAEQENPTLQEFRNKVVSNLRRLSDPDLQ